MGKLAVAGASVLVGGGVSAGGVVLSKMFSFDSTLPKTLQLFKEKGHEEGCIQALFSGVTSMNDSSLSSSGTGEIKDGFLNISNKDKVSGCLVINWDKEEYETDKKWKGDIRFLWAVKQEDKGFVVFTTANTKDKKFLWKGEAYTLEKTGEAWGLSKKKEVNDADSNKEKEMDKTSVENNFPTPHSDLNLKDKSFWGFMEDKNVMDKMCDSSCTGDKTTTSFEGYWEWKGSSDNTSDKKLGDWTSKLTEWWKELFGDDKWKMKEVVKDMTGKWEQRALYGIGEPSSAS